jgi:AcrR family transcriptional regulator
MGDMSTPRQRYRDELRGQIKRLAEDQLAELGPSGISLSAIAREVGMSGPALYRYFASRDALLGELVIDAYNDLADALEVAAPPDAAADGFSRLYAFAQAYRGWALQHPHRYRLLYQPPIPGFDPNEDTLVQAALRSMSLLIDIIGQADGIVTAVAAPLATHFTSWVDQVGLHATPPTVLRAALAWAHLHGFVSLEISSNFAVMTSDPDALFDTEIESLRRLIA